MARSFPIGAMLIVWSSALLAQDKPLIEEIIVSAQRVEEKAQEVPMSLAAFTDVMLYDKQIVEILDVQLHTPNVTATESNLGNRQLSVRGIGNLNEFQPGGVRSVSYHVNQVPFNDPPLTEFYDLERIEVLRGPQGTLYGRNSTAGAVNATTKRPSFSELQGSLNLEVGNYDLVRIQAAAEASLSDRVALRVAGYKLDRNGYINNLADGQIPNVDGDIDGRDTYSFRVTPEWRITDQSTLWLMYQKTKEDDDRTRSSNQVCSTNRLPTTACDPDAFGLAAPNPSARVIGVFSGRYGLYPLGASDAASGLEFDFPRPALGIRDQHTDLEPEFELDAHSWIGGFKHAFEFADLSILASRQKSDYLSRQDLFADVGYNLDPAPILNNTQGNWPTSSVSMDTGDPFGGPCPLTSGTGGIVGGCVIDSDPTRAFAYDQVTLRERTWTAEVKLASNLEGGINWLAGAQYIDSEFTGAWATALNEIEGFLTFGAPPGVQIMRYPTTNIDVFDSSNESYAVFGELYWQPSEVLNFTAGIRYSEDKSRSVGFSTATQSFAALGGPGTPPSWLRFDLLPWLPWVPGPDERALAITDFYGVTDRALAAGTNVPELIGVLQEVSPVQTFDEAREVFGSTEADTDSVTGRIGVDWLVSPNMMLYAFYSRGTTPGGDTLSGVGVLKDEKINAFEVGGKSVLLDGSLLLNVAFFLNGLDDKQLSYRTPGPLPVELGNMDADTWGVEIESRWRPTNSLAVDMEYGWLQTEIDQFQSLDIVDLTQGDPNLVLLRDLPTETGLNFVAPREAVLALTPQALEAAQAIGPEDAPNAIYPDGIPAWFSRSFLADRNVAVSDGVFANLNGNQIPASPEHSLRLGIAYSWFWGVGTLTARWDYYWQSDSYARVFNRPADKIDSWDQHNASLSFESSNGDWSIRAWVRNLGDEDNVTDHYVHYSETAGPYRNYFLAEPRVYGATLGYQFGAN